MVKEKYFFYKGIFIFTKVSCRFLHFDIGVKEKPQNVHLKLIFLPCAQPI